MRVLMLVMSVAVGPLPVFRLICTDPMVLFFIFYFDLFTIA